MKAQTRSRLTTALLAAAVFLVNVYICRELFRIEYLANMYSVEGAFIGMARYITAHGHDLKWFPLWIGGVPYPTTYPPLLPLLTAAVAQVRGVPAALAYHEVVALLYCLGPVALFALALRLSGSRWAAFAAGIGYSCTAVSAALIPVVRSDIDSVFHPRRLHTLIFYGEGPHVTSITLLTFALLALDLAIAKGRDDSRPSSLTGGATWRAVYFTLAAVLFGATAADNWLGAFATVLFVVPYAVAKFESLRWKRFVWIAGAAIAAYCLAMPLIPPSAIQTMLANAGTTGGNYSHAYRAAIPQALAILTALGLIKLAIRRLSFHMQFAIVLTLVFTLVTLTDAYWSIAIVPQGARYHLEMELSICLLAAFVCAELLRKRPRALVASVAVLAALASIYPIQQNRRYARRNLLRPIEVAGTIESRMARAFEQISQGQRVFAPGSVGLWLTAFNDTPEMLGFEFGATDYLMRVAHFEIYTGTLAGARDAEFSVLWMKAMGVHFAGVNGPASHATYKFTAPLKFEGVLQPLWRSGDDVIYRVPGALSLARVVPRSSLAARAPINGIDVDPLRPYVAALDDPAMPAAEFRWTSMHSAKISAEVREGQVISIQMAWAKGWHASVNGRPVPVLRDEIGLMYLDPRAAGRADADMYFDGGAEMRIANIVSPLTAIALLLWCSFEFVGRVILKKSW